LGDAESWYAESHARFAKSHQKIGAPLSLADLGRIIARRGDPQQAQVLLTRALTFFAEIGYAYGLVIAETGLGIAARAQGEFEQAQIHFEMALGHAVEGEEVYEGVKALYELASLRAENPSNNVLTPLVFVIHHPATPHHIRTRATMLAKENAARLGEDFEALPKPNFAVENLKMMLCLVTEQAMERA
jgi:hypothetical protein